MIIPMNQQLINIIFSLIIILCICTISNSSTSYENYYFISGDKQFNLQDDKDAYEKGNILFDTEILNIP